MHKSATKCNETVGKWCKNKHGASKFIDTLETYQAALHKKDRIVGGVKGLGKFLQIILWHLRSLLGPQPDENPRKHAANQLEDFLERNLVRFQQVNCGHERIIVWLQR
jgi:hypothetical protein